MVIYLSNFLFILLQTGALLIFKKKEEKIQEVDVVNERKGKYLFIYIYIYIYIY
jgi:hypothetical protein